MTNIDDIVSHHFICDFIACHPITGKDWGKKSTYETKMCEILARDINIYTHITLAVVIRLFLYIYLSVQGDINMYMRINSICSN